MVIEKKRKRTEPAEIKSKPAVLIPAPSSLLKADEAFPRGGGSVLTPFEYKEATNEAKRDALFEEPTETASKQSKKRKSGVVEGQSKTREGPRIEGLSFKRLTVGTVVLGQISSINNLDLVVSLPNNLSGYVSITNISTQLSSKLENDAQSDAGSDLSEEEDVPELSDIFEIGQWIRATVISVEDGASKGRSEKRTKKRIDLSIVPSAVNKGLIPSYMQNRGLVQASIKSIEDHGLVMDLGVNGCSGFIKRKEYGQFTAESFKVGQVILCSITSAEGDRKVLQLSADLQKNATRLKLKAISNVDAVLPGDGVEVLITETNNTSFSGKVLGLLDATCDTFQAGTLLPTNSVKFQAGNKILARVLYVDPESEPRKVAVSVLPHIIDFKSVSASLASFQSPTEAMPVGFVLGQVVVKHVEHSLGLFCDMGVDNLIGFVHISRVSEGKVDSLNASTGKYKIGSQHPARVVGYSAVDGLFLLSLEQNVIDTKFLNVSDVHVGELIKGTVEKFVTGGVLVKISDGITGLVPDSHITDTKLQFPEKKYKAGLEVQCRVLDTDVQKRRVILTMKKSLVNSEESIISSYQGAQVGAKSPGVIAKLFDNGALIQFYGGVHGFLPASEMSEAYISNPKEHFRIGQTLGVRILKLDADEKKMTLSCRDTSAWSDDKQVDFDALQLGTVCAATVSEKTPERLVVALQPSGFTATMEVAHLSDGDFAKCDKLYQKLRVGGHLKEVVILDKQSGQRQLIASAKSSLIKAAKAGELLTSFDDLRVGQKLHGFVRKAADYGVLIGFANGLTGLALKHNLSEQYVSMPASMFEMLQSVSCTVIEVDPEQKRFQVTLKDSTDSAIKGNGASIDVVAPVDTQVDDIADLVPGKVLKARISSVKETQLNIDLAENIQGRVDVSSVFEDFESIKSKRHPLKHFTVGQEITVKIVGYHDAKNHKFLPLTHRQKNTKTIFECSLLPSTIKSTEATMLDFKDVKEGAIYTAFVNNFGSDCLWVSVSPAVRGRINVLDLETDIQNVNAIQQLYSLGSAIQCRVVRFAASTKHLDLSERAVNAKPISDLSSVQVGTTLPAKITRVSESGLLAQLSDSVSGKISLTDISGEYAENPTKGFTKNGLVQVTVKAVDVPNKKIALSLRTGSDARDPEINSVQDLKVGQNLRGYIKNVADTGLFIELGRDVVARVKIGETTDAFVKDWKSGFSVNQLVTGKVTAVDTKTKRIEFSLKKKNAKVKATQTGLSDLSVGQVIDGTIKKIEDFGVFVQVNDFAGVSGLCHKSEIADKPVKDISAVYSVGDLVKAKILDINIEKRRISFGLKSSYFENVLEGEEDDVEMSGEEQEEEDDEEMDQESSEEGDDSLEAESDEDEDEDVSDSNALVDEQRDALAVEDFDWTGKTVFGDAAAEVEQESDSEAENLPKKKQKKSRKSYDDSAPDLADKQPESVSDFERLILGQPDSSFTWINYMAFHMQLSDFQAARDVGERALKTINYRLESEKLNIWMALLNLENNFGTPATLEATFRKSCEFNDPLDMYSRLVGTLIRSGKLDRAIETYDIMVKKFSQSTRTWVEYATFLASHEKLEEARDLLPRALQSLPKSEHIGLLTKFGCLEFRRGDAERGRTLFEGLLSTYPKRLDLWNVLIDMEATQPNSGSTVRDLFDRVLATKLSMKKAKGVFKKWLQYEKESGEEDDVERVKARAVEYVESH
ncbi:U3 snoRNP-associated protein Rrp5 [Taphrina deformans PYCC 5710]|uniref:rRNA biogenesis protein RRP5 n=1 Tax=Taphrina deformans (strain PYCC 5710 / ATCC 11124 / CBS 356.35 / IMI 108563 / JCM 9778 / NBRC 8474) TaxID=1097556 RepID=R4XAJ9_TAPDE|nr:U3 snoRNP-associated protein Rrp5 [Taphrina deformans PYCC 5710]|eukprot:CCG82813.1 U3 snoRNP-associated protein Rrp5 [Taphrina deformans PYCC 5710]